MGDYPIGRNKMLVSVSSNAGLNYCRLIWFHGLSGLKFRAFSFLEKESPLQISCIANKINNNKLKYY
jgi:hypothetical protein